MKKKIILTIICSLFIFDFFSSIYAEDDITPPTGTILINDGTLYTNSRDVTLTLSAEDISGVSEMRIANYSSYHDWEPYSTTKSWTLSGGGDGLKTVRIKFKDQVSNETTTGIPATITLDTVSPVILLIGASTIDLNINDVYEDLGATASDDINGDITSSIIKGGNYIDTSTAGSYEITYDVKDEAGNSAIQLVKKINVTKKDTSTDPSPEISNENILIRNGDSIIYEGVIPLPSAGVITINGHGVDAQSVIGVLYTLDQKENSFSISDLSYNDSFKSFLLNCITPLGSEQLCNNWNYVVDGSYPYVGMDKNIITGDNNIYLFFGQPNKILLSANSINNSESLTVTAQKYNYENNTWALRTGVTVGIVQTNPNDPYNPTEIKTGLVDTNGQITFSSIPGGAYGVGVKDDYYWPQENLEVTNVTPGSGGGWSSIPLSKTFSVPNALDYLFQHQTSSPMYADWVAIAAGAGNNANLKLNYSNYLKSNQINSSVVTDNERRAMALMALGINPYSGTGTDYIKKIVDSFDGTQFGDVSLTNDDIFALITLAQASYTASDSIISKDVAFILSKESSDGSWEESIDLTSAAVQALSLYNSVTGVSNALSKAGLYLQSAQGSDGGWGNVSSSSWVAQAMNSLGVSWIKNGKTVVDYLTEAQRDDGGVAPESETLSNRIWATAYAIPAAMNMTWGNIMQSFEKPVTQNNSSASVSENTNSQTSNNPVVCPRGDLFSTLTGQACTTTDEIKIITINTPIKNQNLDLVKKIEDKKIIEIPKIKINIRESDVLANSPVPEISATNNLLASASGSVSKEVSVKNILQTIISGVISVLTYIGKGFCNLIIPLFNF